MLIDVYFNSPIKYEVLEKDENLSVRYTDDGYKISFKGDDEAGIYSIMDEVMYEGWVVGNAEKLLEYMKDNYGLVIKPDPVKTSRETTFDIESEVCLGMSHCGAVYSRGSGTLELSDEEVSKLVALIKEKGTSDINELDLENTYPEIYEKLDDAYFRIAYEAEELHWLWYGYHEGVYEYDSDELISYCESECGFVFDGDEEAKMEAFFDDWLIPYVESLDTSAQIDFFRNQMNAILEMDGNDLSYEVDIPAAIIELAKK